MDGNWNPTQPEASMGSSMDVAGASGDWRTQLQTEARQRIVNEIMGTLKRHVPISVPEGLNELRKIAIRFEERIYSAATSQSDYQQKISMKMISMETKTQQTAPINPAMLNAVNQNPSDPASIESTGVMDWQEGCYQKVKSMKEQYFADITQLHQRIALKLQQQEALIPPGKQTEQHEKLKSFRTMLERMLAFLQINKNNIAVGMKEKLPMYEKQILNMVASNRATKIGPQVQGQQQFQHPNVGNAHQIQQKQPSQVSQLQLPDNHANQVQQINVQGSGTLLQPSGASSMQRVSMPISASHQNNSNTLQPTSTMDSAQGSSFNNSVQPGAIGSGQQGGLGSRQNSTSTPQQTNMNTLSHSTANNLQSNVGQMQPTANELLEVVSDNSMAQGAQGRKLSEPVPEKGSTEESTFSCHICMDGRDKRQEPIFSCPICMCALVSPFSTVCGHIFCEVCIVAAIKRRKDCPTCRTKLRGRNYIHRVYLPTAD